MFRKSLITILFITSLILPGCTTEQFSTPTAENVSLEQKELIQSSVKANPMLSDQANPVMPAPTVEAVDPNSPRGVVESFYDWYLETSRGGENILTSRSYQNSPYLTDYLVNITDQLLDSFKEGGYDPFLCAQDIPNEIVTDGVFTSETGSHALVRTDWPGHYFTVGLYQQGENWLIDEIRCTVTTADTAWAFYTWYLGYALSPHGLAGGEISRNALSDGVYRSSGFLSQRLIYEIDANKTNYGADPILGAQELPIDFWVDAGPGEREATVRLQFGPQSARYSRLAMQPAGSGWKIDQILFESVPDFDPAGLENVDTSSWQTLADDQLGFSLRYPQGWVIKDADLSANPADDTMQRSIYLMPAAVASQIQAQRQNAGPLQPPVVPTLFLDVQRATEEQLANYYPTDSRQRVEWQGKTLWIEREPGTVRYVMQSPAQDDLWLVFIDRVSEFEGRETQAADLENVLLPLLASVRFKS